MKRSKFIDVTLVTIAAAGALVAVATFPSSQAQGCPVGTAPVNEECVPNTGQLSSVPALQAVVNALPPRTTGYNSLGPLVVLPSGTYLFDETLTIDRPIRLEGDDARIQIASGVTALEMTTDADGSSVRYLHADGPQQHDPSGSRFIRSFAGHTRFESLNITDVHTGIELLSGAQTPSGNTSFSSVRDIFSARVERALFIDGPDSNGVLVEQVQVIDCGHSGPCVDDNGFLGSTFINASVHANHSNPAMRAGQLANYGVWLAPYLEGTAELDDQGANALVIGGGGPVSQGPAMRADVIGSGRTRLGFGTPDAGNLVRMPLNDSTPIALSHGGTTEQWRIVHFETGSWPWGLWCRNGLGSQCVARVNDEGDLKP